MDYPVGRQVTTLTAQLGTQLINEQGPNIVIPYGYTSIADHAFNCCTGLTSVSIPDSVTYIGDYAFVDNEITSANIPESVTTLGEYAFSGNKLTSISIPDSVLAISEGAFQGNQLTNATIHDGVTYIGDNAFANNRLRSINLPKTDAIGKYAFQWNELTSVDIPYGVTAIGEGAFQVNKLTSVIIPESVKTIGDSAFFENQLTKVDIPKSVNSIGDGAFGSNKLRSVDIPESVQVVEGDAFAYNTPEFKSIDYIATQEATTTGELIKPIEIKKGSIKKLIIGSKNKDKIVGDYYDEILAGREGKDVLTGKGGFDGFLFDTPNSMGKKHADVIKDFDSVEGDSILLGKGIFDIGNKVTLKSVTGKKEAKKASRGNNKFIYDDNKGLLYFNENGKVKGWGDDGGLFTKLIGAPELGASDFTIV